MSCINKCISKDFGFTFGHSGFLRIIFKIADTLETDPNTILGVKNNVASVDEALNELPLEMKSKLSVLFRAMINPIKEQDVIN